MFSREEVHPVDVLEVWKHGVLGDELVYVGKHVSVEKRTKTVSLVKKYSLISLT